MCLQKNSGYIRGQRTLGAGELKPDMPANNSFSKPHLIFLCSYLQDATSEY